jgi:ssDNA-binding Zn-finger/Zn-ribbon topoisomerase 1
MEVNGIEVKCPKCGSADVKIASLKVSNGKVELGKVTYLRCGHAPITETSEGGESAGWIFGVRKPKARDRA